VRFLCVHAAATTPVQQLGVVLAHSHPAVSAFPERGIGSACTSSFSRIARRSLTLRPAHSRGHLFVTRYPKASDISSPPCLLRLLPAGAISPGGPCTHWKAPPCHGAPPMSAIIVTPNILTETSNFAQQIAEPARTRIATTFAILLDKLDEQYVASKQAAAQPEFPCLWLTDSGILDQMTKEHILLTA